MPVPTIALVAGTRPELIKLVPVLAALKARADVAAVLIATAQHRQMLDQVSEAFGVTPDIDLDLMRDAQTPASVTARVVTGVHEVLDRVRPGAVLVHGDTTTCLASTLAAAYARIPVGHVEAGLRTYDFDAPWPEEMNRRLTDPVCRWCFAPTERAADNLRRERIPEERIFVTGNTIVDALGMALTRIRAAPPVIPGFADGQVDGRRLVLVTGHRRESFGEPLRNLCLALRDLVEQRPDVVIVYPVHLNPNVRGPVHDVLGGLDRVVLLEPLAYLPFVALMAQAALIVTDSGGIQEEAPSLGIPVLVTRRVTERPEAVERGLARLVGTSRPALVAAALELLQSPDLDAPRPTSVNPYGDGTAGTRIARIVAESLTG